MALLWLKWPNQRKIITLLTARASKRVYVCESVCPQRSNTIVSELTHAGPKICKFIGIPQTRNNLKWWNTTKIVQRQVCPNWRTTIVCSPKLLGAHRRISLQVQKDVKLSFQSSPKTSYNDIELLHLCFCRNVHAKDGLPWTRINESLPWARFLQGSPRFICLPQFSSHLSKRLFTILPALFPVRRQFILSKWYTLINFFAHFNVTFKNIWAVTSFLDHLCHYQPAVRACSLGRPTNTHETWRALTNCFYNNISSLQLYEAHQCARPQWHQNWRRHLIKADQSERREQRLQRL